MLPFEVAVASNMGNWTQKTVFLAAVSGGADSTAMLEALAAIQRRQGYTVHCLHVDHGIRDPQERQEDAEAVGRLCKGLNIPCRVVRISPGKVAETAKTCGIGMEAAARVFRHKTWRQEARRLGAERVLVAHTQDDLLETVLMRVLRGCGPAGLAAMPKERGQVLRPLLTLSRSDVLAYLGAKKTSFRTDSTNQNIRYLRNRIRRELVPCLDAFFPYWRKTLLAMAETQSRTAKFLESEARKQVAWTQKGSLLVTSGENFFSQSEIIREESLFRAADHLGKFFSAKAGDFEPDLPKKKTSPQPRRKTLRGFGEGKKIDAGPIRIEHSKGDVLVSLKEKKEKEGALVILSPGIYSFMGFKIACQFPEDLEKKETPGSGFFVHLPLVVHTKKGLEKKGVSGYTAIAEDQYGLPEHIVSDMLQLSWKKETPHREDQRLAFIMVSGGNDV